MSSRYLRCCLFFPLFFSSSRVEHILFICLQVDPMFCHSIVLLSPCIEFLISVTLFPSSIIYIKNVFCWSFKTIWGRRRWEPTPVGSCLEYSCLEYSPVLLPGESLGQRSLAGYTPWDHRVGHDWATHTKIEILGASVQFICIPSSCRTWDGSGSIWEAGWLVTPPSIPSGILGASVPAIAGLGQIKD